MTDLATARLADYVSAMGVKISVLSQKTEIPDGILRRSLSARERSLRADEFMRICQFLQKDPNDFAQSGTAPDA